MESSLGAALKVATKIRNKKRTIRVCDDCDTPLIWTFAFPYAERFCINCGHTGGMLGTGKDVDATRDVVFKKKLVNALWKVIYGRKGLIPTGSQRTNCKKCTTSNEYHYNHLTKAEKECDSLAREWLKKLEGTFDTPTKTVKQEELSTQTSEV